MAASDPGVASASHLVSVGPAAVPAGARTVGAVPAGSPLTVTVALTPHDPAGLASLAQAVSTPGSPDYHHYLTRAEFRARFGPTPSAVASVRAWLAAQGLRPGPQSPDGLSLKVATDAGRASTAFHTHLERVRLSSGTEATANTSPVSVDAAVAPDIQAVIGLATAPGAAPHIVPAEPTPPGAGSRLPAASGPARTGRLVPAVSGPAPCAAAADTGTTYGAYTADRLASAYGFTSLYGAGAGLIGTSQAVGVFELEPFTPSDVGAYQACYATSTTVDTVAVDGGAGNVRQSGEAALDIEDLIGLAPGATIDVYEGPNTDSGVYDTYTAMVNSSVAVITTSWGACEANAGSSILQAENTLFQEAAAHGQTVLAASGDNGSEDCGNTGTLAVDDPASQPYVTGVGGTDLTSVTAPPSEVVWNDRYGAGGGGISSFWPMPSWQKAPGVPSSLSGGALCGNASGDCREVPDVSASADPANGYVVYFGGKWTAFGGTSAAAPLWAALVTDVDEGCGAPVGFVNPVLYSGATGGVAAFNDVTSGNNDDTGTNNGDYPATAGYDMASGLGSPIGGGLLSLLCRPIVTGISPATGPTSGNTRVTVTGSGFQKGVTTVDFGSTPAASVTVNSATSLTAVSPAAPTGLVDVTVATPGGTSFTGTADRFQFVATGTSVSLVTAAPTSTTAGDTTSYDVGFKTSASGALAASASITVTGPAGTVWPPDPSSYSVTDGAAPSETVGSVSPSATGDSSTANRVVISLSASGVTGSDQVTVSVSGVSNPTAAGATSLDVSTSADPVPVAAAYAITAGPVSPDDSSVEASVSSVPANGTSTSAITVSLADQFGNPVEGDTVALAAAGGSSHISAPGRPSDPAGLVSFTVSDTTPEAVTYTATDTTAGGVQVGQTVTVTFTTSVNPGNVTLGDPVADASATYTVPFTTSSNGVLGSGSTITLAGPAGTAFPTTQASYAVTDAGKHTDTVSSVSASASRVVITLSPAAITDADVVTVTVTGVTNPTLASATDTLTESTSADTITVASPQYQITPAAVSPAQSTVSASPGSVPADGASRTTVSVTLLDAFGNPVSGKAVGLTQGTGHSTISAASGVSSGVGVVTFAATDTTPEIVTYTAKDTTDSTTITQTVPVAFTGSTSSGGGGTSGGSSGGGSGGGGGGGGGGGSLCPTGATCGTGTSDNTGGSATASQAGTTATASGGTGTVVVGQYATDPVGELSSGTGAFVDVHVTTDSTFTAVAVNDCDLAGGTTLQWWNPLADSGSGGWQPVTGGPGPTFSAGPPACIAVTFTSSTSPSLGQLTGTVFGAAKPAGAAAVDLTRLAGGDRIATSVAVSRAAFPAAGSAGAVVLARDDDFADALTGGPLAAHVAGPLLLTPTTALDPATQGEISRVLPAGGTVYLLGGTAALSASMDSALSGLGYHTHRLAGTDRYATAVAVAKALGSPGTVFLATGSNFPDAVSAGPAAVASGGAILLTSGSTMPAETASYLSSLSSPTVYAVGGPAAAADPGATALVGADRYATAAVVAARFFATATGVGLATGLAFPDALSASPYLGTRGSPVLLVPSTGALPASTSTYLASLNQVGSMTVFGGTAAVSDLMTSSAEAALG